MSGRGKWVIIPFMGYSDWVKLEAAAAQSAPFPYVLCEDFIIADKLLAIHRDFPQVPGAGSFPLGTLKCGDAFAALTDEIRGERMTEILSEKLQVPLSGHPTMVTVRGFCRETDGKIHRDSRGKMATVLLYLNRDWEDKGGGRLRLLNGADNIDDYFLEVPPGNGALLAFRCDDNAWHGHLPFAGARRAIQLNWAVNNNYRRRESVRHFLSATLKKTRSLARGVRVKDNTNHGA